MLGFAGVALAWPTAPAQHDLGPRQDAVDLHVSNRRSEWKDQRRIAWLHVPKAGSSFGTALAHLANESLPQDARIEPCEEEMGDHCLEERHFLSMYPMDTWFKGVFWEKSGNFGGHWPITESAWRMYEGSFYGIFRHPAARSWSAYDHFAKNGVNGFARLTENQYAERIRGTVTKMLAGQATGISCQSVSNSCETFDVEPNRQLALQRLHGFAFIGLTEHWSLSMCLFSVMTKTRCLEAFFDNSRPSNSSHDLGPLGSVYDDDDTAIYEAASARFWSDIKKYRISSDQCAKICPKWDGDGHVAMYQDASEGALHNDPKESARASMYNERMAEGQDITLPVIGCNETSDSAATGHGKSPSVCLRFFPTRYSQETDKMTDALEEYQIADAARRHRLFRASPAVFDALPKPSLASQAKRPQLEPPYSNDGKEMVRAGVPVPLTSPKERATRCAGGAALVVQCFGACGRVTHTAEGGDQRADGYPTHFSHLMRNWLPRAWHCKEVQAQGCRKLFVPRELHGLYSGVAASMNMTLTGSLRDDAVQCSHMPMLTGYRSYNSTPVYGSYYKNYRRFRAFAPMCKSADVVFVQRFDYGADRRYIKNADETARVVKRLAQKRGLTFAVMSFDGMPLSEQQRAVCSTKLLVGQHGAGLAHALWSNQQDIGVLELPPAVPLWWDSIYGPSRGIKKYFASRGHKINELANQTFELVSDLDQLSDDFANAMNLLDPRTEPGVSDAMASVLAPLPKQQLPPLVLTGVAGSGTRVLARAAQLLGFQLQGDSDLDARTARYVDHETISALIRCRGSITGYMHEPSCADLVSEATEKLREAIDGYVKEYGIDTSRPWALKTPHFVFMLPLLARLYPENMRVVTIVRDGRDVALDTTDQPLDEFPSLFPRLMPLQHRESCQMLVSSYAAKESSLCEEGPGRRALNRAALWQQAMEGAWSFMREEASSSDNFAVSHFVRLEDLTDATVASPVVAAMAGAVGCPAARNPFDCNDVTANVTAELLNLENMGHHGTGNGGSESPEILFRRGSDGNVHLHKPQNSASSPMLKAVEQISARGLRTWGYVEEESWSASLEAPH